MRSCGPPDARPYRGIPRYSPGWRSTARRRSSPSSLRSTRCSSMAAAGTLPPPGFGRRVGAPLQDIEIERVVDVRPRLAFDHIVNHPLLPVGAQGLCRSLPRGVRRSVRGSAADRVLAAFSSTCSPRSSRPRFWRRCCRTPWRTAATRMSRCRMPTSATGSPCRAPTCASSWPTPRRTGWSSCTRAAAAASRSCRGLWASHDRGIAGCIYLNDVAYAAASAAQPVAAG